MWLLIGFEVEYTVKYFDRLMDILHKYPVAIWCDAHIPWLVRQPENLAGFEEFLQQCNITPGDNTVRLKPCNKKL